ncbi:MAG: lipid II flippase MurJ [Ramlibacter sp.]
MFLKAGAVSLALLLASRVLGMVRESALAAAFGTSGMADVVVLMLTLPDWLAGLVASGALAYVLVPSWARQSSAAVQTTERRVATWVLAAGGILAVFLVLFRFPASDWLAAGLPKTLRGEAAGALVWSSIALPAALLAALWTTRLQHERDFPGLYGANLVVNVTLILAIGIVGSDAVAGASVYWLGLGLLLAMSLRLGWLWIRRERHRDGLASSATGAGASLPAFPIWLWAALSAGLPLTLPFAARSIASQGGEGVLATFNYAWKLVELPLLLAIQLVATLAFPAIAKAFADRSSLSHQQLAAPLRSAFALAWVLGCAAAAALLVGAPALADLLFGWGRMDARSLARVSQWGATAAWGLLPQALIAVALTVLAAQARMKAVVAAYGAAFAVLMGAALVGVQDGALLMWLLNALFAAVAVAVVAALGPQARNWLPWKTMLMALSGLLGVFALGWMGGAGTLQGAAGLAAAGLAAGGVLGVTWLGSTELRQALRR